MAPTLTQRTRKGKRKRIVQVGGAVGAGEAGGASRIRRPLALAAATTGRVPGSIDPSAMPQQAESVTRKLGHSPRPPCNTAVPLVQEETMAAGVTKKSGKGLRDGVISQLTTYWAVRPGHEEDLRAAVGRFAEALRNIGPAQTIRTGLR